MFCTSLPLFEDVIHVDKTPDYRLFAHNPNAKDIYETIDELLKSRKGKIYKSNFKFKLAPNEKVNLDIQFINQFEEIFERLAEKAPLILPCKEPKKFKKIVKTMDSWCKNTNKSSSIKGLVLHSFYVFRYLKHFGFTGEALKKSLKIRAF